MTNAAPTVQTVQLPASGPIMVTRIISDRLFPESAARVVGCPHCKQNISVPVPAEKDPEPVTWIVSQAHPLMPDMKVIRMFIIDSGVEVYSVSNDGKSGARNLVPMKSVRLTEEAMPLDVFAEELEEAEDDNFPGGDPEPGDPDPGDDPDDTPQPGKPLPALPVQNGGAAS
jgi:hypothetical protein